MRKRTTPFKSSPHHPSSQILKDWLLEQRLNVTEGAALLGVTKIHLQALINGALIPMKRLAHFVLTTGKHELVNATAQRSVSVRQYLNVLKELGK